MMRTYTKLRSRMSEYGWTCADLADEFGLSPQAISNRMSGRNPWNIDEIYKILNIFHIPHCEMYLYFGPGGRYVEPVKPQRMRIRFIREQAE